MPGHPSRASREERVWQCEDRGGMGWFSGIGMITINTKGLLAVRESTWAFGQEFKDSPFVYLSPAMLSCMGVSVEQAITFNEILIYIISSILMKDLRSYCIPISQTSKLRPTEVKWLIQDHIEEGVEPALEPGLALKLTLLILVVCSSSYYTFKGVLSDFDYLIMWKLLCRIQSSLLNSRSSSGTNSLVAWATSIAFCGPWFSSTKRIHWSRGHLYSFPAL